MGLGVAFARGEASAGDEPPSSGDLLVKWIRLINIAAARIKPVGVPLVEYIEARHRSN